ncbi:SAM-dependent methyltransferase [Actinomadura rubrisoli]|uniref:Class I SAM-dependent methyltransferase n=1 Tax=Actinomadura rubrisoli TaxID=2530368 RepID=A0A4R5AYD8_9ACTN|nr:class I SAM-dependent methyltransferase [Actinomadura rubrisoli]TDD76826.1 class I SAM-dependent methyltransferase [Actinomadura rubrisoli]
MAVPERLAWAVEQLAVRPDDRLLEIGCGTGVAVSLVCEALADGRITAIDRSAKVIAGAERRNAAHIAAGRAALRTQALEDLASGGERFDKIFAVNVNLFWVRPARRELALISGRLEPGGELYLFYEPPAAEQAAGLARTVAEALTDGGFATGTSTAPTARSALVCVRGRKAGS